MNEKMLKVRVIST